MIDTRTLLGTLLGTGMGGMNQRAGVGPAPGGGAAAGSGGGLGDILGAIGSLSGGGAGSGLATLGGLAGLLGVGGKLGKGAGLAALGGLALHALNQYQERSGMDRDSANLPEAPSHTVSEADATLLIRAMVAAANADGTIDEEEERHILGRLEQSAASDEEKAFLERELRRPASINEIVSAVRTPELAQQVYAASLMAMTADTPAEQSYLRYLADRVGLDRNEVAEIHKQLGAPPLA